MFGIGGPELVFIFVLALLIFGPKKLPQIGRTIGKGMAEFRKASTELQRAVNTELEEPPAWRTQPAAAAATAAPVASTAAAPPVASAPVAAPVVAAVAAAPAATATAFEEPTTPSAVVDGSHEPAPAEGVDASASAEVDDALAAWAAEYADHSAVDAADVAADSATPARER